MIESFESLCSLLSMWLDLSFVQSNKSFCSHKMCSEWICEFAHCPASDTSYAATHLYDTLSLLSRFASGCSFHLLPLYQAIPTVCLCKHNKRHGCTRGPPVLGLLRKQANLWSGSLRPSCLAALTTQDIKALWFCRSQLLVDRG